jgi:hypothetical protein
MFGTPAERKFLKILAKAQKKTAKEMRPLRKLSLAIVNASMKCLSEIKILIEAPAEKDRQHAEIFAFYELLYFFLHLAMRQAFKLMSEAEIKHLQEQLGHVVVSAAVNSYFDHWPDDLKAGMTDDFYKNLNTAEIEYAECSRFDSPAPPEGRSDQIAERLFNCLGQNVAAAIGRKGNFGASSLIANTAIRESARMNLRILVEDFKRDSMGLPPPPHHF